MTSEPTKAARDRDWLRRHGLGVPVSRLARESQVSARTVQLGIARAREAEAARKAEPSERAARPWWLELVPLFPVGPFTPSSECPHHGPLPAGSLLCCMVCSASGVDDHPSLRRNQADEPKPEPRPR